ncbi:MAG: DUF59 domain-containing protein [Armatimonadetes bacterium]|nr:DUF59 domain-containing protein [Armatimonadota bacterium]
MVAAPPGEETIREALRDCCDPEIPVNMVDLGLLYGVEVGPEGRVRVEMTLTSVGCPEAESMVVQVRERVEEIPGVTSCEVALVWTPPWDREMMTEDGRVMMRILGFG